MCVVYVWICMYVNTNACVNICMYVPWTFVCRYVCKQVCIYAGMHLRMHVCIYACMHLCMCVWTYVCMYLWIMEAWMYGCIYSLCKYACIINVIADTSKRKESVSLAKHTVLWARMKTFHQRKYDLNITYDSSGAHITCLWALTCKFSLNVSPCLVFLF